MLFRSNPGLNVYRLVARDAAGNEGEKTLRLSLSLVSIKIDRPVANAVTEGESVIVSGTYEGPLNSGITVNGVAASGYNDNFVVIVPVNPGANTLTARIATLDGQSASDTIDITVNAVPFSGGFDVTFDTTPIELGDVINTIAGTGEWGAGGDGGPATQAQFGGVMGIAIDANQNIFVAEYYNHRIRRISADGIITTVAGSGGSGSSAGGLAGDGGPAAAARLRKPSDVAVGPDGSLYIADRDNNRIRRVTPDGTISTVAGSGDGGWWASGFSGDGGPATSAQLRYPEGVAVGQDGTLYIADSRNHRIRMVTPDGIISTIAGDGTQGFFGDGDLATEAGLALPSDIVIGPDGSLYVADTWNNRIRRFTVGGTVSTVAGNGSIFYWIVDDNVPATQSPVRLPQGVAVADDGTLYIADSYNHRIRKVTPDGIISTIAGSGSNGTGDGSSGDGGPADKALIASPWGIGLDQQDSVVFSDQGNERIRKISRASANVEARKLTINVTVTGSLKLQRIEVDIGADGTVDIDTTSGNLPIEKIFSGAGSHPVKVIITDDQGGKHTFRSEEHTSELQSH